MKYKIILISFSIFLISITIGYSQDNQNLKNINSQVWQPFTLAFESHDYALFSSIHSQDLIRVSGDGKSIRSFSEYIEGYKNRWKNTERKQTISFRFLERINNGSHASERGIYKLTMNLDTPEEVSYYGKFHVLLKQESNIWKLIVDYDSSELKTINVESYKSAFAIDDFEKY